MRKLMLMLLLTAAAVFTGCARPELTRPRFETLHVGITTQQQVLDKLGRPTRVEGDTWTYIEQAPYRRAVIRFEKGKVAEAEWSYLPSTRPAARPNG